MIRRVRALPFIVLAVSACSRSVSYYAPTPWPDERVAVVTLLDTDGRTLTRTPLVTTGDRIEIELDDEAATVHVETFALDLSGCGASFMPLDAPYPAALEAFVGTVDDDRIAFAPRTTARPVPLHFEKACNVEPPLCDRTTFVSEYLDLLGLDLLTVDRIDDTTLLFGATQQTVGRINIGGTHERFDGILGSQCVDSLVASPDRLIVATLGGAIIEFDATGAQTSRVDIADAMDPRVTLQADGGLLVTSDAGVYTIARGATVAVARDDVPVHTVQILEVPAGRFAVAGDTVQRADGTAWITELTDGSITPQAHLVPAGDDVVLVAPEVVFLRSSDGAWRSIGSPFTSLVMSNGLVSRGMLAVIGDTGALALTRLDAVDWCRIDTGVLNNYWDLTTTADGRTIYVVGSNTSGASPPVFTTIALPEL